jgi:hypothetical protein
LAARIGAFEASLCYAKITPASRTRGEFAQASRQDTEALGGNLKFEPGDLPRASAVLPAPVPEPQWLAAS